MAASREKIEKMSASNTSTEKTDTRTALERLFEDGAFEHLIVEVFEFLDGPTLEACYVVCKRWRDIVRRN